MHFGWPIYLKMAWIIDFSSKNIVSQKVYQETVNQLVQSILNTDAEAFMIFVNISGRNSGNTIEDASEPHVNTAEEWLTVFSRENISQTYFYGHFSPWDNYPGAYFSRYPFLHRHLSPGHFEISPSTFLSCSFFSRKKINKWQNSLSTIFS